MGFLISQISDRNEAEKERSIVRSTHAMSKQMMTSTFPANIVIEIPKGPSVGRGKKRCKAE